MIEEILKLKKQRNAVILAHNYQRDEVQDIADYTGDSLELSRIASKTDFDVIVFCGVGFMAESASILSPNKIVLLPDLSAGCPMADMVTIDTKRNVWTSFSGYREQPVFKFSHEHTLMNLKAQYPEAAVVAYVNTSAKVKAYSDICCTSANVVKVVESLPNQQIICIPDKNLSMWAAKNSKKDIISWDGFCHVHDRITAIDVERARQEHPNALFIAHPECRYEVLEMADMVTSTSGMLRFATESTAKEFIVGTEIGIMHRLKKENPDKIFHPLRKDMVCPNMKKTNLENILMALKEMKNIIKVPEEIRVPAKQTLDKMLLL